MNSAYEDALKEAFAVAPANKVVYHTLEVIQEGVQGSVLMVQARRKVIAIDENGDERVFNPVGFQFSLPPSNEEGFTSLNLAIDNIDRRVSDFITASQTSVTPIKVIYRPYLSDDLTRPQMDPPLVLYLKDVNITNSQVTGRCTFMDVVNKKFPVQLYTRQRFLALE